MFRVVEQRRTATIFHGAWDDAVAIWGSLPGAIGDFAFQAANGLISGVEAMLNGVVTLRGAAKPLLRQSRRSRSC